MDIFYKNNKLKKEITDERKRLKLYGQRRAYYLGLLLYKFEAAPSLATFVPYGRPERCHELTEGKRGKEWQLSADLEHPYRLIFRPTEIPPKLKPDGGLDWSKVTAITILGVEDTHDN